MKKMIILGTIFLFNGLLFLTITTINVKNDINKMEKMIGTKVILERDTLRIIDYSLIHKTYKLSNDQDISRILTERLQVVK
jgi:hypothetical protein